MRLFFALALAAACAAPAPAAAPPASTYASPYSVRYSYPLRELIGDLDGRRGAIGEESSVPFASWYSPEVRKRWGAWGPPARHYPAPDVLCGKSADWKRERVVAVAMRFVGYAYQHHHVPDWDPPGDWPWLTVGAGRNGRGVDCSNLTAFVYNLGFGIKPTSAIRAQADQRDVPGPNKSVIRATRVELSTDYDKVVKTLRTGDLLFVKNTKGDVSHVAIWVGAIGRSPDGTPLVLDSTGTGARDSNKRLIPSGVRLRPFAKTSWYFKSASHARRYVADE